MLDYVTAGESHGACVIAVISGMPAGVRVPAQRIAADCRRRRGGYGRSQRMSIEADRPEILTGIRKGRTTGGPITIQIRNRDFRGADLSALSRPRPGHADLAGAMKYGTCDFRDVMERASARETAGRTAAGAVAKCLLRHFGIEVVGYVVAIGPVAANVRPSDPRRLRARINRSPLYCPDARADKMMVRAIDAARVAGDTLGGIIEIVAFGAPPGLGSCMQHDLRLDGRLARALLSIQAMKAVEVGIGFEASRLQGSQVHDAILPGERRLGLLGIRRGSNNAGGIEGGISNGQPIVLRAGMKPIPTLGKPLESVDLRRKAICRAERQRSDVCAVPAASVVGEAVVSFEIAAAFLEKFGGDAIKEVERNYQGYMDALKRL